MCVGNASDLGVFLKPHPLSMDDPSARLPWLEISILLLPIVFLLAAFKTIVLDEDEERFVHLKVPIPEQCSPDWKGEVLDEPTVKVPCLFDMAVGTLLRTTDIGIECHKMLLPSQWPTIGAREPFHA